MFDHCLVDAGRNQQVILLISALNAMKIHEACTHPRNEPPTISVVAIEESQVERENHPQQIIQSSKSWKSWTIGP